MLRYVRFIHFSGHVVHVRLLLSVMQWWTAPLKRPQSASCRKHWAADPDSPGRTKQWSQKTLFPRCSQTGGVPQKQGWSTAEKRGNMNVLHTMNIKIKHVFRFKWANKDTQLYHDITKDEESTDFLYRSFGPGLLLFSLLNIRGWWHVTIQQSNICLLLSHWLFLKLWEQCGLLFKQGFLPLHKTSKWNAGTFNNFLSFWFLASSSGCLWRPSMMKMFWRIISSRVRRESDRSRFSISSLAAPAAAATSEKYERASWPIAAATKRITSNLREGLCPSWCALFSSM